MNGLTKRSLNGRCSSISSSVIGFSPPYVCSRACTMSAVFIEGRMARPMKNRRMPPASTAPNTRVILYTSMATMRPMIRLPTKIMKAATAIRIQPMKFSVIGLK